MSVKGLGGGGNSIKSGAQLDMLYNTAFPGSLAVRLTLHHNCSLCGLAA